MASNTGEIDITIGGETFTLRSSLRAAKEINAVAGSFMDVNRRIVNFDLGTCVAVIAAGLGKSTKEIEAKVYSNGLINLVAPLVTYVNLLANGGRPIPVDDDGDAGVTPKGED